MSSQEQTRLVVVGVDGTPDSTGALRFAVAEAAGREVLLHVVHVVPDHLPVSPIVPEMPTDLARLGAEIVEKAVAQVHEIDPTVRVEGWVRHGARPVQLAEAARDADVLVLGRDARPLLERLLRGNTGTAVAARATVPVVEVPAEWAPRENGVVLVGVKSPSHASELLGDAFAEAARRGATLVVLHAWKLPSAYDDVIEVRVDGDVWREEGTSEMEHLIAEWRTAYPEVPVEVRVVHDHPAHALVEASAEADLLVVVRRARGVPAAAHLGSTARVLLRAAQCPIKVVAPTDAAPMPSLVLEEDGRLAR